MHACRSTQFFFIFCALCRLPQRFQVRVYQPAKFSNRQPHLLRLYRTDRPSTSRSTFALKKCAHVSQVQVFTYEKVHLRYVKKQICANAQAHLCMKYVCTDKMCTCVMSVSIHTDVYLRYIKRNKYTYMCTRTCTFMHAKYVCG